MCYECYGVDQTISHYHQLKKLTTDRQTLDSIGILIAKLEADKRVRHPDTASTTTAPTHPTLGRFRGRKKPRSRFRKRTSKPASATGRDSPLIVYLIKNLKSRARPRWVPKVTASPR